MRNVSPGMPFAVKFVDFMREERHSQSTHFERETLDKRESYEIEKEIMTFANHPEHHSHTNGLKYGRTRNIQVPK